MIEQCFQAGKDKESSRWGTDAGTISHANVTKDGEGKETDFNHRATKVLKILKTQLGALKYIRA